MSVKEELPTQQSLYLKVILGDINVTLSNNEKKFKYKEQYEKFKLIVNALILVVAVLDIMFSFRVIDACLHFLLVWYHCTLTIRESILIVNGSRIKGWWRALQFITGIKAGIIIVWPDGLMYDLFRRQFLYYIVYTSFLQFLQFYYQHNCLYRLRALGERYEMDITIQGFHSWMWRGLGFLIPFLYLGYAFQFYNAYTLYNLSKHPQCSEWQVAVSSFIFSVIFLGNTITTSLVVQQKFKEKMIKGIQQTYKNLPSCPSVPNLLKKDQHQE
ncbi:transmembrane protein 120A [Tetranychus urticae]|uniref:Transmembrane protein 120 homolog n=1 Tax=Tetranychus urticae TaxID=32264 RepID=T1KKM6_TETUR|nr:transmembrane protein 120A [Tetranychus urticae]